jgi:hypothetical protein
VAGPRAFVARDRNRKSPDTVAGMARLSASLFRSSPDFLGIESIVATVGGGRLLRLAAKELVL